MGEHSEEINRVLNQKKTEAGWQRVLDDFWLKATPKWFEW
jgi:hypothetical protein